MKFKLAALKNEIYDLEKHFHLPDNVMSCIKPIFQDLSNPYYKCVFMIKTKILMSP